MKQSREVKGAVKVNKTNLYNLVKAKSPFSLPKMRYTHYEHYRSMHYLTYTSKGSIYVKCSFGSSYGDFLLRVEAFGYDEVFELSFDDLLSFGLVKEVSQDTNDIEENTTEQEQPAEDAEYEEDCWSVECSKRTNGKVELTLGIGKNSVTKYYSSYDEMYEKYKDNPKYKDAFYKLTSHYIKPIELTPLERTVFKAIEDCSSLEIEYVEKSLCAEEEEQERYFLGLASIETLKANFLQDLISKAGLDDTYQSWLRERKKQEAVTVL